MYQRRIINLLIKKRFSKFIIAGLINAIISNAFLLLLLEFTSVGLATFLKDVLNSLMEYFLSSSNVFKKKGRVMKFINFYTFSWLLKWYFLELLLNQGFTKLVSILLLAPFFVLLSYTLQKYYVFR